MDVDSIVRCDDCLHYNRQFNDCEVKDFKSVGNSMCSINCIKYSPKPTKIMLDIAERMGLCKILDFIASNLNN